MIKKKFRDLTLLEFNDWVDKNCHETLCDEMYLWAKKYKVNYIGAYICTSDKRNKDMFSNKFLGQEIKGEKQNGEKK